MLRNRVVAWLITIIVMIIGLFLGSYMSFRHMRSQVVEVFHAEVVPIFNEQLQMLYNMRTLYLLNAPDTQESRDFIEWHVNWVIDTAPRDWETLDFIWNEMILRPASELYERAAGLDLSENDARLMRSLLTDIDELVTVMSQAGYNALAQEFNDKTWRGLGFLTHNNSWNSEPSLIESLVNVIRNNLPNYGRLPVLFRW